MEAKTLHFSKSQHKVNVVVKIKHMDEQECKMSHHRVHDTVEG